MQVWLVTKINEMYGTTEDVFIFGSRQRALDCLRSIRNKAENSGMLEDFDLTWAAPWVTAMDTDNTMYTFQLDPVAKTVQ